MASSAPPPVEVASWGGGFGAQPRQLQTSWIGMQMMVSASSSASRICPGLGGVGIGWIGQGRGKGARKGLLQAGGVDKIWGGS